MSLPEAVSHTEIEEISFMLDSADGHDMMVESNGIDEGYLNVNLISGEMLSELTPGAKCALY